MSWLERKKGVLPMLVSETGHTKVSGWLVVVEVTALLPMNFFMPLDSITNKVDQIGTNMSLSCGITSRKINSTITTSVPVA